MDFSANLTLPYVLPNQAQKHVTLNEGLRRLDALVQLSVISADLTSPPEDPGEGDRYLVGANSDGDWIGAEGQVAAFQDGAWAFFTPQTGWLAWVEAASDLQVFDGEAWIAAGSAGGSAASETFGINAAADTTNRLSVSSAATLFNHEGASHQLKINKASEADSASVLFQSNWSGRAEIGLTGSDDFLVKISPDGESFTPAILARPSTGFVGIGTWSPTAPLHVEGAVRLAVLATADLPDAASVGAGALVFQEHADRSIELVYSDGGDWRSVQSGTLLV